VAVNTLFKGASMCYWFRGRYPDKFQSFIPLLTNVCVH